MHVSNIYPTKHSLNLLRAPVKEYSYSIAHGLCYNLTVYPLNNVIIMPITCILQNYNNIFEVLGASK